MDYIHIKYVNFNTNLFLWVYYFNYPYLKTCRDQVIDLLRSVTVEIDFVVDIFINKRYSFPVKIDKSITIIMKTLWYDMIELDFN